jgi:hypothetical protein
VSYTNGAADGVTIKTNDVRLAGTVTGVTTTGTPLGVTFQLGAGRLGGTITLYTAAVAPLVVDVLGTPRLVSRVTQTFGLDAYQGSLELATAAHPA